MKNKKIITIILILAILLAQFAWVKFFNSSVVYAGEPVKTTIATKYFYKQLTKDSKVFYETMEEMLKDGSLKKGNVSKEITNIENLDTKLNEYASGKQDLLNSMGAARDAFISDYPNIFYVDFDYFTLRVTQSGGKKHLYVGTGRSDNYINKEFLKTNGEIDSTKIDEAIATVDEKINKIVEKAEAVKETLQAGQDLVEQQVKVVHNEIAKITKYTYEHQTDHPYTIRTTYGVFGLEEGNAVCSGMAKALKTCLDKLNIPCVLVQGVYRVTENQPEEHMWAYVQLSDYKWYAVDVTFDNTDKNDEQGEEIIGAEYFLVGADRMYKHVPTGIMSASNYEFSYPELEVKSDKFDVIFDEGPLKVELDDESYNPESNESSSILRISYNGHGYQKAIEEDNMYILVNQYQEGRDGQVRSSGWSYPRPDIYENSGMLDTDDWIELMVVHVSYMQVAITDIAPAPFKSTADADEIVKQTTYLGSEESLIYKTDLLYNPNGEYVAPPYVKRATPSVSSVQYIGKTYPVTIEYDDVLIPDGTGEKPSVNVMIYEPLTKVYRDASTIREGETHEILKYKITDFKFDETSTFTFNFTPSEMWADDTVYYIFDFKGLMGSYSHKKPLSTVYQCAHPCSAYAYVAQGFNLNVYGKPVLMDDNIDMSQMGLEGLDSTEMERLSNILKHRLTLVTTKTTKAEESAMQKGLDNFLEEEGENREVMSTETYNINLTLCKEQQKNLKDGMGVRVMLGFPKGYGPEDAGVTFKAYHYIKNDQGEIIEVEEIPCTITPLGLIIEVYSFSPFTIATVTKTESDESNTDKSVVLNVSEGGKVLDITDGSEEKVADTVNTLKSDGQNKKQFKIVPDSGYEIDEIIVGDEKKDVSENPNEYTLDITYDSLEEETTKMVKVAFAAKSIHDAEKEAEVELVSQPVINNPSFTMASEVYQKLSDEEEKAVIGTLNPGDKFEVTFSIDSFNNIGNGINTIGGTLNYDKEKLDLIGVVPLDNLSEKESVKWAVTYNNESNKFVVSTSDSNLTKVPGEVFTAKFKVKESLSSDESLNETTTISLTDLTAGTGNLQENAIATASDISKTLELAAKVEDSLTIKPSAQNYKIIDESQYIVIPVNTTVKTFNENINVSKTAKYHTTEEQSVSDEHRSALKSVLVNDDSQKIATGDTVTVGDKIWTFSVRGDVDGNGEVGINDISKMKLHFIEMKDEALLGPYLVAAETDDSPKITVNDISRVQLFFIEKLKDLFAKLIEE